jgi:hypothetical protein
MLKPWSTDLPPHREYRERPSGLGTTSAIASQFWTSSRSRLAEWQRRADARHLMRIAADIEVFNSFRPE